MEVDLVLSGSSFMVRTLRLEAHFLDGKTDLTPDIFASVQRCDIQIARLIIGNGRRVAMLVLLEEIELGGGTEPEFHLILLCAFHGLLQDHARIGVVSLAVCIYHITKHPDDPPAVRTPWKHCQGGRVRLQIQPSAVCVLKALDPTGADADPLMEGLLHLTGHHGNVLLHTEGIPKSQPDKADILFLYVSHYLFRCIVHMLFLLHILSSKSSCRKILRLRLRMTGRCHSEPQGEESFCLYRHIVTETAAVKQWHFPSLTAFSQTVPCW